MIALHAFRFVAKTPFQGHGETVTSHLHTHLEGSKEGIQMEHVESPHDESPEDLGKSKADQTRRDLRAYPLTPLSQSQPVGNGCSILASSSPRSMP